MPGFCLTELNMLLRSTLYTHQKYSCRIWLRLQRKWTGAFYVLITSALLVYRGPQKNGRILTFFYILLNRCPKKIKFNEFLRKEECLYLKSVYLINSGSYLTWMQISIRLNYQSLTLAQPHSFLNPIVFGNRPRDKPMSSKTFHAWHFRATTIASMPPGHCLGAP